MYIRTKNFFPLLSALVIAASGSVLQAAEINASSLLRTGDYRKLDERYTAVQRSFDAGKLSGDQLRDAFRVFYPTDRDLAAKYDAWVRAYPKSYVARLARGIYYKKVGLEARGGLDLSDTEPSQLAKMDDAMTLAVKDFGGSLSMDPKPFLSYFHTIDIGRQYIDNQKIRQLFDKAAALDPNSLGLRMKFMSTLEPRWGGSVEAMRAFLEECKHSKLAPDESAQLEALVYEEVGREDRTAGDVAGAEAAYRKSLASGPCPCEDVRKDLNDVLFETRQYASAIQMLDQYVRQTPTDLWALATRGIAKVGAGRPDDGIVDLTAAANAGDVFAQSQLGAIYLNGAGMKPDYDQSVYWFRKAAAQGDAGAASMLPEAEARAAGAVR